MLDLNKGVTVAAAPGPDRWLRAPQLWWRTRDARKSGDIGSLVKAVAAGADTAVGVKIRDRHILLLLEPSLVGSLLIDHAPQTTKGPGTRLTRQLLGDGLLTSEGANHDRARRLIAPAFSRRRLATYTDSFAARTRAHISDWDDGQTRDAHGEMASLTLDIVGRTLLGIDLTDRTSTIRGSLEAALARFAGAGGSVILGRSRLRPRNPLRRSATRPGTANALAAETELHGVVDQVIEQRRANPTDDRGDVVSALLSDSQVSDGMTAAEIHDHVITLLMAGHETTANALTWALFLLGQHPAVQDRLYAEVKEFADRGPAFAQLPSLPYTRAVVSEAMRLYPPAWFLGRTILEPLEFGGWHAPAGTLVGLSPMLMHRDPRWFADPDRFDPDRWLDERRGSLPKNSYLPFGTGPRACIGEQFAWAETSTALAVLTANVRFHTDPAFTPEIHYRVTLRPSGAVPIRVSRRHPSHPARLQNSTAGHGNGSPQ